MVKVYLDTLGCRLNESEIEQIGRAFVGVGYNLVKCAQEADICVINTCAVTTEAGKKSRNLIRKLHRQSPDAQIIVTGCYSEIEREQVMRLPGVVNVVSNLRKDLLVADLLDSGELERNPMSHNTSHVIGEYNRKTRASLKVQDGCDYTCAYCITTIARGPSRSRKPEDIVRDIQAFQMAGYREVVLSGVNLGAYGQDLPIPIDLKDLLSTLLTQTDISRIRISSLEPWDIPVDFFQLWQDRRLCRYLHLPLQAGSERTLQRMNRRTRLEDFCELVTQARTVMPDVALGSDIIVGFPGETDSDFADSLAFVRDIKFCNLHVFRYSPRPSTPAATMPNQIPGDIKSRRAAAMQQVAEQGRSEFCRSALGQTTEVLWEKSLVMSNDTFLCQGLTDNAIRIKTLAERDLHNQLSPVLLERIDSDGQIWGVLT